MADETVPGIAIISRAEAKAKGLRRYFTGSPCLHGHLAERDTHHRACLACQSTTWLDQHFERFVLDDAGVSRKVVARAAAKASGLHRYFTGKPCKYGHISERFATGTCCKCSELFADSNRLHLRSYSREYARQLRRKRGMKARNPDRAQREELRLRFAGRPRPKACETCGKEKQIRFDHCHTTGSFRGWICDNCNLALGLVKDDPAVLRNLAAYIERHIRENPQIDWVRKAEVKTLLTMRP